MMLRAKEMKMQAFYSLTGRLEAKKKADRPKPEEFDF
jgi:hypothetical protein